ncbi:anti-sigma-D factor RsdA [Actinokineospora pegani]|uniref:anti-sigma-D factor RsdA n=1 Tax=Actinokineospora pegani TaxID=2654637 RepID=UPI0018D411E9|nr:anti-sigma-D factor RsdA [Actinokineospora pegani]
MANVTPVTFGVKGAAGLGNADPDDFTDDDSAVDISLVHADDAFLDALGSALREGDGDLEGTEFADDELAALLSSWRAEVDGEPIGELVDTRQAQVTLLQAKQRKRARRPRLLVPVAAAAAVLAIAFTGAGLAARDAQPGEALWSLTKVLYADHARSVEAAAAVREDLQIAQAAINAGKVAEAKGKLAEARDTLPEISTEDGHADLALQHENLMRLIGSPVDPATPPPLPAPSTNPTTPSVPSTSNPPSKPSTTPSTPPPSSVPTTPPSTAPETPPTTTSETTPTPEVPRIDPGDTPVSGNGSTTGSTESADQAPNAATP